MKLKFVQQDWGKCLFYCLANIFNDNSIIENGHNGGYHMDARKVVERKTNNEFSVVYHALVQNYMNPISDASVFKSQKNNSQYYTAYIVSVPGSQPKTYHCLLVFNDCLSDELIVFDPMKVDGVRMLATDFMKKYSVFEIETICTTGDGGQIFFNRNYFNHLGL